MDIKDISNIFISRNLLFSQLEVVSRTFEDNEVRIRYLTNSDAIYIRSIIEGLRILTSKHVDTSVFSTEELVSKLEELGTPEVIT